MTRTLVVLSILARALAAAQVLPPATARRDILERRDRVVTRFEQAVGKRGEAAVFPF